MAEPPPGQILFRCHACRQKYAVKPSRIGAKLKCTKCQVVLQVPKESALDRPEASKPTVHVKAVKVTDTHDSINELSFDDLPAIAGDESVLVSEPGSSDVRRAHANAAADEPPPPPPANIGDESRAKSSDASAPPKAPASDDAAKKTPTPPPGKKLCPNCAHACPTMALACPFCQHRFEMPKVARPAPAKVEATKEAGKEATKEAAQEAGAEASKASASSAKPKKDLGKVLDQAVTMRGQKEGRPVEPPMWMDENVYGSAFKMGFAGVCCLVASVVIFIQLDSPESARHAFFLVKWIYAVGGRWIPTLLCLGGGLAFLFFAIKPVIDRLKHEKAVRAADETARAAHASAFSNE